MAEKKILVVDDEAALRSIVCAELQEIGYDVSTAEDGDEALAILQSKHFDLILLDNQMQRVDGVTVLKRVRSDYPETKVIMVTGSTDVPLAVDEATRAPEETVIKPFGIAELVESIKRILETQNQRIPPHTS
jgi:DNA-binding NtrC family response regulator